MRASFSNACSEDVMARARQGALTANEWEGFTHHLATCAECRVTWQVMIAFQQSAAPMCGDERILKRACQLALIGSRDKRSPTFRARVRAAAAALILVAGVASAATLLRVPQPAGSIERAAPIAPPRTRVRKTDASSSATLSTAPAASADLPGPELLPARPPPSSDASAFTHKLLPLSHRRTPHLVSADDHTAPELGPDASTLFARALSERSHGRPLAALSTFRSLQSLFPGTPQAILSLISVADLALDGDNAEIALAALDQYLLVAPSGSLVPEALAGKARALDSLGRAVDAAAVRRDLNRRFPDSDYLTRSLASRRTVP